jgi:hypothetical protein
MSDRLSGQDARSTPMTFMVLYPLGERLRQWWRFTVA